MCKTVSANALQSVEPLATAGSETERTEPSVPTEAGGRGTVQIEVFHLHFLHVPVFKTEKQII